MNTKKFCKKFEKKPGRYIITNTPHQRITLSTKNGQSLFQQELSTYLNLLISDLKKQDHYLVLYELCKKAYKRCVKNFPHQGRKVGYKRCVKNFPRQGRKVGYGCYFTLDILDSCFSYYRYVQ